MTPEEKAKALEVKRRQRFIEYVALIGLQSFFVTGFLKVLHVIPALACSVLSYGLAWNLAQLREQRRIQDIHNAKRLMGDALESLILLLSLVAATIMVRISDFPFVIFMSYLALCLMMYFMGSMLGEAYWFKKNFSALPETQRGNYIENLNRSLLFPYNIPYLKRVFRSMFRR